MMLKYIKYITKDGKSVQGRRDAGLSAFTPIEGSLYNEEDYANFIKEAVTELKDENSTVACVNIYNQQGDFLKSYDVENLEDEEPHKWNIYADIMPILMHQEIPQWRKIGQLV